MVTFARTEEEQPLEMLKNYSQKATLHDSTDRLGFVTNDYSPSTQSSLGVSC